jgi:[acyl-carrier-protein] S-malonyltransferase
LQELAGDFSIGGAAGLSLGELTAHAAAGTFDFENGLKLVQKRGVFMDEACAATTGGMAAMIGAEENAVRQLADEEDVDVANINSPGQVVVSGELAKVEAAVAVAKEHGIRRATMLNVAGAYHSRLMESAYEKLGAALLEVQMQISKFPVISNVTGREVETLPEIRQTLQDQVTSTVRWVDCMERLASLGCDLFIELGPGGVLAGLLKRTRKEAEVISVSDVASIRLCAERLKA